MPFLVGISIIGKINCLTICSLIVSKLISMLSAKKTAVKNTAVLEYQSVNKGVE